MELFAYGFIFKCLKILLGIDNRKVFNFEERKWIKTQILIKFDSYASMVTYTSLWIYASLSIRPEMLFHIGTWC